MDTYPCKQCGKTLMQEQAARNNMFCSNKCSADSRGREPEIRPCAWCGKRVTRAQALHGCIYCSRKCTDLGRRKKLETSSQCLVCKKDFTRIEMLKGRKYCSRKCYGKASIVYREPRQCEHCDKQLDRETLRRKTARWCSVRVQGRVENETLQSKTMQALRERFELQSVKTGCQMLLQVMRQQVQNETLYHVFMPVRKGVDPRTKARSLQILFDGLLPGSPQTAQRVEAFHR